MSVIMSITCATDGIGAITIIATFAPKTLVLPSYSYRSHYTSVNSPAERPLDKPIGIMIGLTYPRSIRSSPGAELMEYDDRPAGHRDDDCIATHLSALRTQVVSARTAAAALLPAMQQPVLGYAEEGLKKKGRMTMIQAHRTIVHTVYGHRYEVVALAPVEAGTGPLSWWGQSTPCVVQLHRDATIERARPEDDASPWDGGYIIQNAHGPRCSLDSFNP